MGSGMDVVASANGNFLFVWNTGGTKKGCRKAPRPIFPYLGRFPCVLVVFSLVSDGLMVQDLCN